MLPRCTREGCIGRWHSWDSSARTSGNTRPPRPASRPSLPFQRICPGRFRGSGWSQRCSVPPLPRAAHEAGSDTGCAASRAAQSFSMAQLIGASMVIVLPWTSTTTRSQSTLKCRHRLCGFSPFMPTASIHSWFPMRGTITVSQRLEAARRCHFEATRAHRHIVVGDNLLGFILRCHTGCPGNLDEGGLTAAEATRPPPRPPPGATSLCVGWSAGRSPGCAGGTAAESPVTGARDASRPCSDKNRAAKLTHEFRLEKEWTFNECYAVKKDHTERLRVRREFSRQESTPLTPAAIPLGWTAHICVSGCHRWEIKRPAGPVHWNR